MTDTSTTQSPIGRREPKLNRKPQDLRWTESTIWNPIQESWQQLYGGFYDLGVSIERHGFELANRFEWSRSFHADSLELCLNLAGCGSIHCSNDVLNFEPLTAAFYLPGKQALEAWREANQPHRFITVEFSARFLRQQLSKCDGALHPLVAGFVRGGPPDCRFGEIHRLTSAQEQGIAQLLHPPVLQGARCLWYQGKVLELMAEFFFERRGADELFCDRQKRLARERVDRVVTLLRQRLAEPPSLDEIGREVGCSPFHLSRTFSAQTGMTIPQYLRKLRMERAAELLQSGRYNVTEAALEVGYSSLSHFSQSFCQTMGCCPGLFPLKTLTKATALGKNTAFSGESATTAKESQSAASADF
jgi:AraC family transcriptional regulator